MLPRPSRPPGRAVRAGESLRARPAGGAAAGALRAFGKLPPRHVGAGTPRAQPRAGAGGTGGSSGSGDPDPIGRAGGDAGPAVVPVCSLPGGGNEAPLAPCEKSAGLGCVWFRGAIVCNVLLALLLVF